ncbi:hypothetical protein N7461_002265 [Penicillium sp. DV-2018c]|nr:hypothetical protein N7461_002265 [Penicillium sp. DV-2018c]
MTLPRSQAYCFAPLTTCSNWATWISDIEYHARLEGVWDYCNPDNPDEDFPELHEPEKPEISMVKPDATSIVDLEASDFTELSSIVGQYWRQMWAYDEIQSSLHIIFNLIKSHVDEHYLDLIKHAETPREQLMILSDELKKNNLPRMQAEWERIQHLARGDQVQELFERWKGLYASCAEYIDEGVREEEAFWDCLEPATSASSSTLLQSQYWIASRHWVVDLEYMDRVARVAQLREQAGKDRDGFVSGVPDDSFATSGATECATPSSCHEGNGRTLPSISSFEVLNGRWGTTSDLSVLNSEYPGSDTATCTSMDNGLGAHEEYRQTTHAQVRTDPRFW